MDDVDPVRHLTAQQHGLVTRAQAIAAGLSGRQVEHRVASGRWAAVHRGVYLTEPGPFGRQAVLGAAVLACGSRALLSHRTAAAEHGLVPAAQGPVEVTVPAYRRVEPPAGVVVHRTRDPERGCDDGAGGGSGPWPPRTPVARTVLDVADTGTADEAVELAALACSRGLTSPRELQDALRRRPRHRWRPVLLAAVADLVEPSPVLLTLRYQRRVESGHGLPSGLPEPASGSRCAQVRYPDRRVRVELVGLPSAGSPSAGGRPGDRPPRHVDGWAALQAGWSDVVLHGCELAVDVACVLAWNGWPGRAQPCRRSDCAARTGARTAGRPDARSGALP